jgi:hypothetical protein
VCDPSCCGDCCDGWGCGGCCYPGNRFYASAEYLLWWTRGMHLPPLVTTGSIADADPGALGQPHTQILYGDQYVLNGVRSGARFNAGWWFTDDHCIGIDGGFLFLGKTSSNFFANSTGSPGLYRPFINMTPGDNTFGQEVREIIAQSVTKLGNAAAGAVTVHSDTSFWGGDINLRSNLCCNCNSFIDVLVGYRTLGLDDNFYLQEQVTSLVTTAPGSVIVTDRFSTRNHFNGGQLGIAGEARWGRFTFGGWTKVGMGVTRQTVNINGTTVIGGTGTTADGTYPFGILAAPSNSGSYSRDVFTVVPEVGLNIGYFLNDHVRIFMGYTFLYWSNVARAGDQIDRRVDANQFQPATGTGSFPAFAFNGTGWWAQGLNWGVEFRY